jgi:hypothetical protein
VLRGGGVGTGGEDVGNVIITCINEIMIAMTMSRMPLDG